MLSNNNCCAILWIFAGNDVTLTVNTMCCSKLHGAAGALLSTAVNLCLVTESGVRSDYLWIICCDNLWNNSWYGAF